MSGHRLSRDKHKSIDNNDVLIPIITRMLIEQQ